MSRIDLVLVPRDIVARTVSAKIINSIGIDHVNCPTIIIGLVNSIAQIKKAGEWIILCLNVLVPVVKLETC